MCTVLSEDHSIFVYNVYVMMLRSLLKRSLKKILAVYSPNVVDSLSRSHVVLYMVDNARCLISPHQILESVQCRLET